MLNKDILNSKLETKPIQYQIMFIRIGFTMFVALLGSALGMIIATNYTEQQTDITESLLTDQQSNLIIESLKTENEALSKELLEVSTSAHERTDSNQALSDNYLIKINALEKEVQSLNTEVSKSLTHTLNNSQFDDIPISLERHRTMLVELRKSLPQTREGSAGYWYNMKNLATKADPSLSSSIDRVILKIDNYYDWNDNNPGTMSSSQDFLQWQSDYRSSGAIAYEEATIAFTKDALQAVITKLEATILMYE